MVPGVEGDGMAVDLRSSGGLAALWVCTRILCVGWVAGGSRGVYGK